MFKFDLESGSKGDWFRFFESKVEEGKTIYSEPEADAGRVCVRVADAETLEKIQAETRTRKSENIWNKDTRQYHHTTYYDQTPTQEKKEREMIWDHAIVDWENIIDSKGNQISCTLENKMKLMSNPMFARFIGRCFELITGNADDLKAASEKN
jgi:hypothetical protein